MNKHTCKNCGRIFEYCRGCLLSPIPYKDAGYCSKGCYEESKISKIEEVVPVEDVEAVVVEEDISTSEKEVAVSSFFTTSETIKPILKEDIKVTTKEVLPVNTKPQYYHKKKKNKK